MWHGIEHNITNTFDDRIVFLPLVERVTKTCVDRYDIVYVPEDLF